MNARFAGIVGAGVIGHEVLEQIRARGGDGMFFPGRCADEEFDRMLDRASEVYIAISDKGDKGAAALGYLLHSIKRNVPVATAEKTSTAYGYHILRPFLKNFGCTASLGGGSRLLDPVRKNTKPIDEITAIVNGSLNFGCWGFERGYDATYVLSELRRQQLVDPGATTLVDIIHQEIQDALYKTTNLCHFASLGDDITPDEFSYALLPFKDVVSQIKNQPAVRFVVRIRKSKRPQWHNLQPFFLYKEPWLITGEFVPDADKLFKDASGACLPVDVQHNALILRTCDGEITEAHGIGAGPRPTVEVMIQDIDELMQRNR